MEVNNRNEPDSMGETEKQSNPRVMSILRNVNVKMFQFL